MEVKLTKEADKLLTVMYREYLNKRKAGQPKSCAKEFEYDYLNSMEPFNAWPDGDFSETLRELASKNLIKVYIGGDSELTDDTIATMEYRFVDGFKSIASYLSQFIP